MSGIVYSDGRYRPYAEARSAIDDRGLQFSDGVYEMLAIENGKPLYLDLHLARLASSLAALRIPPPTGEAALILLIGEIVHRNRLRCGSLYIQITRGAARRDHIVPTPPLRPILTMIASASPIFRKTLPCPKAVAASAQDIRWRRPDIKTLSLLGNVMARREAMNAGADDVWMVDRNGFVTEASAANSWIILHDGTLVTRPLDGTILPGVTRRVLLDVLKTTEFAVVERPFTLAEARSAREAFVTSTLAGVKPVVALDDHVLGNGEPGSATLRIRSLLIARDEKAAAAA